MGKVSIYQQEWYAREYDDENFGEAFGRHLRHQEVKLFLSLVPEGSSRVLDLGAGTGKLSIPLTREFGRVVSADASAEMLKVAREGAEKEGVALTQVICDARQLCYKDEAFDCVISSRMLMHIGDWRRGISEMCRVSRGVVAVDFPPLVSLAGFGHVFRKVRSLLPGARQTYNVFLTGRLVKEFERNDFRVVSLTKHFFLPVAVHRWLNRPRLSLRLERFFARLALIRPMGAPITLKAVKVAKA